MMHARIEEALRELPLSDIQVTTVVAFLAEGFIGGNVTNPDSRFFEFRRKVSTVAAHFAPDGLVLNDYLQAAVKRPQLFYLKPETVIATVNGVAARFRSEGLTLRAYLRAAVEQPMIFYLPGETIIGNIMGVTDHFRDDGLKLAAYLRAALRQPQLFCQSPDLDDTINSIRELTASRVCGTRGDGQILPGVPGFPGRNPGRICDAAPLKAGRPKTRLPVVSSKRKRNEVHYR